MSYQVTRLGDLLGLVLTHGLFEDTGNAIAFALLSLEIGLRPIMQEPTKPV